MDSQRPIPGPGGGKKEPFGQPPHQQHPSYLAHLPSQQQPGMRPFAAAVRDATGRPISGAQQHTAAPSPAHAPQQAPPRIGLPPGAVSADSRAAVGAPAGSAAPPHAHTSHPSIRGPPSTGTAPPHGYSHHPEVMRRYMRQDEAAGPQPPQQQQQTPQVIAGHPVYAQQQPRGPPPQQHMAPAHGTAAHGHPAAKPAYGSNAYPGKHDSQPPQSYVLHGRQFPPGLAGEVDTKLAVTEGTGGPRGTSTQAPKRKEAVKSRAGKSKKQEPAPLVSRAVQGMPPQQTTLAAGVQNKQPQQQPRFGQYPPQTSEQTHPPQQQGAGGGQMSGMRELRVEDALLYLDQVKMEFKDRPQIYNQFLAIMKNFKTQEVDTPGVIKRVSQLFRGYDSLILGFNTFLPEGFKISLADLRRQEEEELREQQEAEMREQKPSALSQQLVLPSSHSQQQVPTRSSPPSGPPGPSQVPPQVQAPPPAQVPAPPQAHVPQAPPQAQAQVPPTHAPSLPQAQGQWNRMPAYADEQEARKPPPKHPPSQAAQVHRPPPPTKQSPPAKQPPKPPAPVNVPPPQQPPVSQHQAVEFDHAISYVTKIKRRFANDPSTYHSFLEILHTYQKEQRGIKEVLEQVAHLFQDHPDLLKEFTFFLPDAVQEQAKERLHRAAAESEARQAVSRQQQMEQYQASMASPSHSKFIDMTRTSQQPLEPESAVVRGQQTKRAVVDGSPQPEAIPVQPEAHVYNAAVERQFFDMARESLTSYTRDGGQAWAEFLKCLDMYAQDILSRTEMLNFVEPLLGKRNTKLFEEFKRILNAAGSPTHPLPLMEDSWHSVPLSEIDFSRCRRCSPSYRALPRDYPAPPCNGRSEEESKILNDIWVSLPVGSEESYTFRHMRRNTYEETLFRVEDERFEIDMAIDSNAATLRRLEPIAEEIAQLAQEELCSPDLGAKCEGTGLGGRRFQFTYDKKTLGVINRNAVARIYGDSGQEMLDLLVKNPTVAIPIVVQRLKQKDREWRVVRDRLNRHWKELAQLNYYKSLDHRGLTWRTFDKRATSARTLVSEIKDRAVNGGVEGQEALKQKLDKAKEEHGSFYEVTMAEVMSKSLDLTFLPKPDRRLFTPHLSLLYENNSWAQRDAYRILAFALERGHIAPGDKEKCHRLWIEFLGPFLGLSLSWMHRPAAAYQESTAAAAITTTTPNTHASVVSEEDDEDSMEEEAVVSGNVVTEELRRDSDFCREFTDHHPLPAGTQVSTLYGEGKIVEFRRSDYMYVVALGMGAKGYLRPATVLGSIFPVEKSAYTRDLRSKDMSKLSRPDDQLVIGTQSLYLFFRLHHILVRRLNIAKQLAYSVGHDRSLQTLVEQMPDPNPNAVGRRRYEAYLSLVYALLDGGVGGAAEGGKYEDRVRGLLGNRAYELATLDKLISHIWKNVQAISGDETMFNLTQLYRRQLADGGFKPESFRQEAAYHSEGEPMYAFQYCPVQGKDCAVLHFEYLGVMEDSDAADEIVDDDDEGDLEENLEPTAKRVRR